MGKNAGQTVQALLARAPAPPRAHAPVSPAAQPDQRDQEHHGHKVEAVSEQAAPAETTPAIAAPLRRRRRSPAPTEAPAATDLSAPAELTAPPTLRLSQPIAEALRTAWLAAKRDRVLLTYQDFAGEIIATGLWHQHTSDHS